jgi:hypothetical protein
MELDVKDDVRELASEEGPEVGKEDMEEDVVWGSLLLL